MIRCRDIFLAWLVACLAVAASRAAVFDDSREVSDMPFAHTAIAPDDVTMYLHVTDAAAIRHDVAHRPIMRWVDAMLEGGQAAGVWRALADETGVAPERLFDACFGTSATLIVRSGSGQAQWVLITEVESTTASELFAALKAVVRGPKHDMAVYELPEHELLLARTHDASTLGEGYVIIGPQQRRQLFSEVLRRIDRPQHNALNEHDAARKGRAFGGAASGLIVRHDPPLGGWSVAVADFDGGEIALRHFGNFESSPLMRSVSEQQIDPTPLRGFEDESLIAVIEPTDIGGGQLETFLQASLGKGLLSAQIRRNVSDRRIIVFGEIEGRQEPQPVDIQATTVAVCLELKSAASAERHFDRQMVNIARRLDQLGGGEFDIDVPCHRSFEAGTPRSIDIAPAAKWLAGALPLARPITLNWMVLDDGESDTANASKGWAVIATHPQRLQESVRALKRAKEHTSDAPRQTQSCGFANGTRIGRHLRSWSERADLFAAPQQEAQVRSSLLNLSRLASGIDQARWHLSRPSTNEMCLEMNISLAAPESAGDEHP